MELKMLTGKLELVLEGDLVEHPPYLWYHLHRLKSLHPTKLIVDASKARINPAGVEFWVELVSEVLYRTPIEYTPSQLALVLKYDDSYTHKHTTFPEDGSLVQESHFQGHGC
jgi:hypothetical protein